MRLDASKRAAHLIEQSGGGIFFEFESRLQADCAPVVAGCRSQSWFEASACDQAQVVQDGLLRDKLFAGDMCIFTDVTRLHVIYLQKNSMLVSSRRAL